MKTIAPLILLVGLSCLFPENADADTGDIAIGAGVSVGVGGGDEARVIVVPDLLLRVGLLDWLHFDAEAGVSIPLGGDGSADVQLGLTAALDVFSWVPEFTLGAFMWQEDDGNSIRVAPMAGLRVRYHLDAEWSLAGGGEFGLLVGDDGTALRVSGSLSVLYALD